MSNAIFTNMYNSNLNPIELLKEASIFYSILFNQHIFNMFFNIG